MTFPCPKGVLPLALADHNRNHTLTREFFGNSYSSPTPSITTLQLQDIGLCIMKAFATHIRNATRKFGDHPPAVPRPYEQVPTYPDRRR
jgi:hypothetical protein